jgi:rRNA maturation endonuclease Nob1
MLYVTCALLAGIAGYYVLLPLFKEPKGNLEVELLAETELDRLLNRKAVVYTNLKDLDFEFKMGRLSESDYQRLEAGYKAEAVSILKKLDTLGVEQDLDEAVDREIVSRRARLAPASRDAKQPASTCPSCGSLTPAGKRFCADCGHQLT